ncbi:hypothetical protein [Rathayibacter sp. AY1E3]|uniref:hypothetical protein n=1 Tax=Rathayibacter sp. AY1E3 TaxID=2080551 RepID=UPI0011B090F5|nr:hypothetical protein [Rathayibacter sp. AY1E3]
MPRPSARTSTDPVRHFLKRAEAANTAGRWIFFLALAGGLLTVGINVFSATQLTFEANSLETQAESSASRLKEVRKDFKGAEYRHDLAWEKLELEQTVASQIYDEEVARGVEDGTISAPIWPASVGFDPALKKEFDDRIAASSREFVPFKDELEKATERFEKASSSSDAALIQADISRATADAAWARVAVVSGVTCAALVVLAALWFLLSSALLRARATVALAERTTTLD